MLKKLIKLALAQQLPPVILLNTANISAANEICLNLAKFLLCLCKNKKTKEPCCLPEEFCQSCLLCMAETHIDLLKISPVKTGNSAIINIEQIRDLIAFSNLRPQIAQYKVIIITEIQYLNNYAINALLKTLEEPNVAVTILLTVTNADLLLPTLRSRCTIFNLDKTAENLTNSVNAIQVDLGEFVAQKTNSLVLAEKWSNQESIEVIDQVWVFFYDKLKSFLPKISQEQEVFELIEQLADIKKQIYLGNQVNMQLFWETFLLTNAKLFNRV